VLHRTEELHKTEVPRRTEELHKTEVLHKTVVPKDMKAIHRSMAAGMTEELSKIAAHRMAARKMSTRRMAAYRMVARRMATRKSVGKIAGAAHKFGEPSRRSIHSLANRKSPS